VPYAYISGTGYNVPPRVVTNQDLVDSYGMETSHEWIVKRTGIEARRFSEEGIGTAELAEPAARAALAQARIAPPDLDMIIFATLSPDYAFPGSGVLLQSRLGVAEGENPTFVPALDIRNQCSGFLYGLQTATALVKSGAARHVLLVGAETHSAALDLSTSGRTVSSLFGDGAGAVIVSATEEKRGVRRCYLGADGRHAEVLCQKVWDIKRRPFIPVDEDGCGRVEPDHLWAQMDGRKVFRSAVTMMIGSIMNVCGAEDLALTDIDLFFFHQANMRINQYVAEQLGLPEDKVPHNIQRYGNTTAATIPMLLAESVENGQLQRGMTIACVAFGSGFTWGAAIIDW
jgi:3-oxoacyl-[acyl-carrier-protein] synthase-3